jgi:hypothetical protein
MDRPKKPLYLVSYRSIPCKKSRKNVEISEKNPEISDSTPARRQAGIMERLHGFQMGSKIIENL